MPLTRDPRKLAEQAERARQWQADSAIRYEQGRKEKALNGGKTKRNPAAAKRKRVRKRERFARAYLSEEYVEFVHSLACSAPRCQRTDIEAAHVGKPRSRGGRWDEIAPLCSIHHSEQEKRTPRFNATYGVDLESVAAAVALRWMEKTKGACWAVDRQTMGPRGV
jgi:hypothetical protein